MNYYDEIKTNLISNEVYKKIKDYSKNRSDLDTYYKVGKLLAEAGKHYGEGIIKQYSIKLTEEIGKCYSERTLRRFRQFYLFSPKWSAMRTQLNWSTIRELLVLNDVNEINYYIKVSIQYQLTYRQLHERIKSNEYNRLSEDARSKLSKQEEINIRDLIPNPILIKNKNNIEVINEKNITSIDFKKYFFIYEGIRQRLFFCRE